MKPSSYVVLALSLAAAFACALPIGLTLTPLGLSTDAVLESDYQATLSSLESSGFTHVKTTPLNDLEASELAAENKTSGVRLFLGDSFEAETLYPRSFPIELFYHSARLVKAPRTSSSAEDTEYETIVDAFEKAGFSDINVEMMGDLKTGWLKREGTVSEVLIDGSSDYSVNKDFRVDAEVVIRVHSFKPKG